MANNYLQFNGISGFITVPDDAVLKFGSGDFSICFWVNNIDSKPGDYLYKGGSTYWYIGKTINNGIGIYIDDGTNHRYFYSNVGVISGFTHVCFSCNSVTDTIVLYINGVEKTLTELSVSGVWPNSDSTQSLYLCNGGVAGLANCKIDDLRIYKGIALNQSQVNTIYASSTGKKYDISDAGAGLAFNFDEGSGNPQSTGTATLTGTITGGVTWLSGGVPFDGGCTVIPYNAFDWE